METMSQIVAYPKKSITDCINSMMCVLRDAKTPGSIAFLCHHCKLKSNNVNAETLKVLLAFYTEDKAYTKEEHQSIR